jgi:hypothetical protein
LFGFVVCKHSVLLYIVHYYYVLKLISATRKIARQGFIRL